MNGMGRNTRTLGGSATKFLYDGAQPVQELSGTTPTANLFTGLGLDDVFSRTDSAGARTIISDAVGSSVAMLDSSGAIQTQYTYAPFGATTATGASNTNPFQFTEAVVVLPRQS